MYLFLWSFFSLPLRVVVSYKQSSDTTCSSLPSKKVWLRELTVPMTIAVDWNVKHQNKQKQKYSKTLITGHFCSMLIKYILHDNPICIKQLITATCCSKQAYTTTEEIHAVRLQPLNYLSGTILKTKSNFTLLIYIPFLGIGDWYLKCV